MGNDCFSSVNVFIVDYDAPVSAATSNVRKNLQPLHSPVSELYEDCDLEQVEADLPPLMPGKNGHGSMNRNSMDNVVNETNNTEASTDKGFRIFMHVRCEHKDFQQKAWQ